MLQLSEYLRNFIQAILIDIFNITNKFSGKKILLFSRFMKKHKSNYVIKKSKIGNCYYILNYKDLGIARRIYIGLDYEHLKAIVAIDLIHRLRKKQKISVLYDIGANIGNISIPLLAEKKVTRSVMFEPNPENFKLLKINVILNNLQENSELHNVALGKSKNDLILELSHDNYGDHRIKISQKQGLYHENSRETISIMSLKLDEVADKKIPSEALLIWIDVQGFESEAFLGVQEVFSKKPALVVKFALRN